MKPGRLGSHGPISAWGGRRLLTSLPFVAVLVAVVLLVAAAGIVWLQRYADERRTSQLALADLQLDMSALRTLAGNASERQQPPAGLSVAAEALGDQIRRSIAAAARAYPGDEEIARTLDTAQGLTEQIRAELGLVEAGRSAEALQLDQGSVATSYGAFLRRIDDTRAAAGRRAEDAVSVAGTGTLVVLAVAGGLVLLLLRRFAVASRRAREAYYDPLTGLGNRMLFSDRLGHALALAERRDEPVSVVFLDLDDFKIVNDSLGHLAGDELLKTIGDRVRVAARASDTVVRLGGDEFAFLLEGADEPGVRRFAERIRDTVHEPVSVAGRTIAVNATLGFAVGRAGESAPDELLRNADLAMYAGKHQGKGRVVAFEPAMYQALADRLELEADLKGALARGELSLAYQPIVEVETGRLIAAETLCRWTHPVRGDVPPGEFIPIAEETGAIREIGRWVLAEACAQLRRWQDAQPGADPVGITVNVSPVQFHHDELVADVRAALERSGVEPGLLTLEITESMLIDRGDAFIAELEELSALGIRIAVDDFGTGYLSLSTLARFPVDVLKIDRAFVEDVERNDESRALVRSIVQMGRSLGLTAVAEGVEGVEQLKTLQDAGCDLGQGFHFARPTDAETVGRMIARSGDAAEPAPALRPPRAA
jgi:diguanylate cyclase (GGDEF)-like protein